MYGGQPLTDGLEEAALRLPAHGALGLFDEAFGHIAADIARLTGGQIAVIALLEIDAQLAGDFILHLIQRALASGTTVRPLRLLLAEACCAFCWFGWLFWF